GLHSSTYFNKSVVGMHPPRVERLCRALAEKVRKGPGRAPAHVVAPVMGAVVFGYETARQLDLPFMFLERKEGGGFEFRRGFALPAGAPTLVVEDVISTGLSAGEAVAAVREAGGEPVAVACLVDRSGGKAQVGAPLTPLLTLDVPAYAPDALPPELAAIPAVKPGSRGRAA
ncbi:MAG: orotate phosphoribosyltransferase, partial [Caulobacterales bacterium]|nr:orotate phosphoribosyltransferase [Caulobacterales bacterium]